MATRSAIFHILAFMIIGGASFAQDINITKIELDAGNVLLHYDLEDSTAGRYYTINVYSSRDNFINPLQKVEGDLGLEVSPGRNRKIQIKTKDEFGETFNGKVAFELRAKVYIPFIRLDNFDHFRKFKRGKLYEIHWTGGRPQNVLNFELYRGETKVSTFSNIGNAGKYMLTFPVDTKPGKRYRFRISDMRNKDEVVNTGEFRISRKVPLLMKAIPAVGVGAALYFLLQPDPDCEGCLPGFPKPDDN